jgi:hypothetical protein
VLLKSAYLLGPFAEYAELLVELAWRARIYYKRLGCIIAVTAAVSGILWTISALQAGTEAAGGLANLGAAGAAAVGGGLGTFAKGACFF